MLEGLTKQQIEQFVHDGFIRIDNAFSEENAQEVRDILWQNLPCDPNNPGTWTKPVIRLGMYAQEPFVRAANTDVLHRAFDQLVGFGKWISCKSMGTFPVRFPSNDEPDDTGWHVDASFPGANPANYLEWRINVRSKGRALLMLFLFSDSTKDDAPPESVRGRIWMSPDYWRKQEKQDFLLWNLPVNWSNYPKEMKQWPLGKQARFICVILFWFMQLSLTGAKSQDF
ncbi:phytanoyl-CoA dioxygenase family protein [Spirosoma endbachense]|uniref:hypothetical protein n=1 Tax=Spirosoma endbachense TaxID=2666025 RepID=UPI00293BCEFF|nr:hypothetical protein [Spirosoma endbachense]